MRPYSFDLDPSTVLWIYSFSNILMDTLEVSHNGAVTGHRESNASKESWIAILTIEGV